MKKKNLLEHKEEEISQRKGDVWICPEVDGLAGNQDFLHSEKSSAYK